MRVGHKLDGPTGYGVSYQEVLDSILASEGLGLSKLNSESCL